LLLLLLLSLVTGFFLHVTSPLEHPHRSGFKFQTAVLPVMCVVVIKTVNTVKHTKAQNSIRRETNTRFQRCAISDHKHSAAGWAFRVPQPVSVSQVPCA
jgi:hypothetical protein